MEMTIIQHANGFTPVEYFSTSVTQPANVIASGDAWVLVHIAQFKLLNYLNTIEGFLVTRSEQKNKSELLVSLVFPNVTKYTISGKDY